jgi:FSR family fosmidomycin resistance protein-like MFS transporter
LVNYFRIPANGLFIATVYRFYTDKTEALFLSNRYGVHFLTLLSINSVLDTGGSFLVGIGSSIFQKRHASLFWFWRERGLAQSIFQLGGNTGSAIGPLLVAIIVAPYGQSNIIWFVLVGILGIFVLTKIAVWYQNH